MITRPEPNSSEEGLLFLMLEEYDALRDDTDADASDDAEETHIARRAKIVEDYAKKLREMIVLSHVVGKMEQDSDVAESSGNCKCNGDCVPLSQLDEMVKQRYGNIAGGKCDKPECGDVKQGETYTCEECGSTAVCAPTSDFFRTPNGKILCEPCLLRGRGDECDAAGDFDDFKTGCRVGYDEGYNDGYAAAKADAAEQHGTDVLTALSMVALKPYLAKAADVVADVMKGVNPEQLMGLAMNLLKIGQPTQQPAPAEAGVRVPANEGPFGPTPIEEFDAEKEFDAKKESFDEAIKRGEREGEYTQWLKDNGVTAEHMRLLLNYLRSGYDVNHIDLNGYINLVLTSGAPKPSLVSIITTWLHQTRKWELSICERYVTWLLAQVTAQPAVMAQMLRRYWSDLQAARCYIDASATKSNFTQPLDAILAQWGAERAAAKAKGN